MSHSSETNRTDSSRKTTQQSNSIPEHIHHLAEELEIDGADGLEGNEMEVIALIRNCPLLYDKSYPDFNDATKKDQAWRAIAQVFNVSSRDLQQFWDTLKQEFLKFCSKSGEADEKAHPSYLDEMQFLKSVSMRCRRPSCSSAVNRKEDSNSSPSSESDVPNDGNYQHELNLDILIEKIHANPILYDRKHKEAKNHDLKLKTWKKLAKEIGIPVSECVNRWKILREKYGRERKYRKTYPDGRKWYLFEKLSFLEGHVFKRKYSHTQMSSRFSKGIFNETTNPLREESYSSSRSLVSEYHYQGVDSIRGSPKTNTEYDRIMDKLSTRQFFDKNRTRDDDIFVSGVVEESLRDEDELFALSIATELKKMNNRKKKMKLKADMFKLLHESSNQEKK